MSLTLPLLQSDCLATTTSTQPRVHILPLPAPTVPLPPLPSLPINTVATGWTFPSNAATPDTTGWTSSTAPAYFPHRLKSRTGISNLSCLLIGFQTLSLARPPLYSLPVTMAFHRISTIRHRQRFASATVYPSKSALTSLLIHRNLNTVHVYWNGEVHRNWRGYCVRL